MKKTLLALLALTTTILSLNASCFLPFDIQYLNRCSYYIQASGGAAFWGSRNETILDVNNDELLTFIRNPKNYLFSAAIGMTFDAIRLEAEFTKRQSQQKKSLELDSVNANHLGQFAKYSYMANFLYDIKICNFGIITTGAGLGVANTTLGFNFNDSKIREKDYRLAFQLIFGPALCLSNSLQIFVHYRLFGSIRADTLSRQINANSITLRNRDVPMEQSVEAGLRLFF